MRMRVGGSSPAMRCAHFDFEYFFFAVDFGEYDCVQEPVRESVSPSGIIAPAIVATAVSTGSGVIL